LKNDFDQHEANNSLASAKWKDAVKVMYDDMRMNSLSDFRIFLKNG
jgi:hypothetical protein